ncbi:hypothetical protein H2198_004972 [Neophaeococcomyces mojaviensis]|uniref:Uncharacterized protein n=1 Tax=Neophaeococcomyces mojaviensis TaxID=3383035 RepID=A0ACC3A739_9EURO|nr:hypothetical protein H2198_004972 [Knufia sp. JES_112]
MTSFLRRFSLSSSQPDQSDISNKTQRRKSSSASQGTSIRILGARDYKLASQDQHRHHHHSSQSPHRRRSSTTSISTLTNDPFTGPARILGARDYQQAISPEELQSRRSSVASTLVEPEPNAERRPSTGAAIVSTDGRIYGARDYKVLARKGSQ